MAGETDNNTELALEENIRDRIFTIRGVQVMLDSDLAALYNVETRVLNQAVKRNMQRFPEEFCFQLRDKEPDTLTSQIVISNDGRTLKSQFATSSRGGRRTMPYAFTEQGVAMLSAVLRSDTAIKTSIQIMNAFVAMRHFIASNALLFQRMDALEIKQFETENKVERVLAALDSGEVRPKQGIFYNGQVFDAYAFVSDLIRSANASIVLIDNYLDDSVLTLLTKRKKDVRVTLLTRNLTEALAQGVRKCSEQYPSMEIREFKNAHDRFIIIDYSEIYHFGASLKDLGKKWFAFSRMDVETVGMLARLDVDTNARHPP
ncbi:MAG: ORF6N domain-containing protein [Thermoplasmata archaeon]